MLLKHNQWVHFGSVFYPLNSRHRHKILQRQMSKIISLKYTLWRFEQSCTCRLIILFLFRISIGSDLKHLGNFSPEQYSIYVAFIVMSTIYLNRVKDFVCLGKKLIWKVYMLVLNSFSSWALSFRLFETLQSLFWSIFGLINLYVTNVQPKHEFTEFVGATMFGTYNVISLVVLLNMLIAMMNNSYQLIAVSCLL